MPSTPLQVATKNDQFPGGIAPTPDFDEIVNPNIGSVTTYNGDETWNPSR